MAVHSATSYSKLSTVPPGIAVIRRIGGKNISYKSYQISIFILTFLTYACFHAARKPPSIVKSVLNANDNSTPTITSQDISGNVSSSSNNASTYQSVNKSGVYPSSGSSTDPLGGLLHGWAPFSGSVGKGLLGDMDVAFLVSYSLGMYVAGHLGDSLDLRLFLSVGMTGTAIFTGLFGMGFFWNVHNLSFFILMQIMAGLFQSTGWPSVVSVIANWFGREKRGLVMGIWNSHTSFGNILGSLSSSLVLPWGWGWSFLLPSFFMAAMAAVNFLFLVPHPDLLDLKKPMVGSTPDLQVAPPESTTGFLDSDSTNNHQESENEAAKVAESPGADLEAGKSPEETRNLLPGDVQLSDDDDDVPAGAIGFLEAWKIPGVAAFAFCLFFTKLVAYTFLDWLPFYISHTEIAGVHLSNTRAGLMSILFDVGGIFGGIAAGHLSDKYLGQATVAASFMIMAIPTLGAYVLLGHISIAVNLLLLVIAGFLVNGPYALITCAVSADLGQHSSLKGNGRALATVTAIIDGTGSIGAAFGPFLTGFLAQVGGDKAWGAIFAMLMTACLLSVLCLWRLVRNEIKERCTDAEVSKELPVSC